jgi:pimeloyl-ACP methyl ester carboxylesterase
MSTLVLLPGMDGSRAMFGPFVAAAPPDVDLITADFPRGPANGYDDLLPLVVAALPRDRPFFLLGWSFSGPLALLAAAARPPFLRGVVLAATFIKRPLPLLPPWSAHLATRASFEICPRWAQVRALLGGHGTRAVRALLIEALRGAGAVALARRARAALSVDATQALRDCPVPVLYVRSTRDGVIPSSRAEEIRRVLPSVEVADVEGPHLALVTAPEPSWRAIDLFMRRPATWKLGRG